MRPFLAAIFLAAAFATQAQTRQERIHTIALTAEQSFTLDIEVTSELISSNFSLEAIFLSDIIINQNNRTNRQLRSYILTISMAQNGSNSLSALSVHGHTSRNTRLTSNLTISI